jgi:hypothetical protein
VETPGDGHLLKNNSREKLKTCRDLMYCEKRGEAMKDRRMDKITEACVL